MPLSKCRCQNVPLSKCRCQNVPVRVPLSKPTVFEICRQKLCCFRVNEKPIRHIFHCFQNAPASCERCLRQCMVNANGMHGKLQVYNTTKDSSSKISF